MDSSAGAGDLTPYLTSNLGNMYNLLAYKLDCVDIDIGETIQAIISLNELNMLMARGLTPLILYVQDLHPRLKDHRLHGKFIVEAF
jgi:hypothetical protein